MNPHFAKAVIEALNIYAGSLGISRAEALRLYSENESTRECIGLLVIAQADPVKLRAMALGLRGAAA